MPEPTCGGGRPAAAGHHIFPRDAAHSFPPAAAAAAEEKYTELFVSPLTVVIHKIYLGPAVAGEERVVELPASSLDVDGPSSHTLRPRRVNSIHQHQRFLEEK